MSTNISEIVWLDGPSDPSFVVSRDNDDAHYFYWPIEISVPIRTNDTEPVKVGQNTVLSRYHFYGLTIWVNPPNNSNMPIASFAPNFHTPIIIDNRDKSIRVAGISDSPAVSLRNRISYVSFRRLFTLSLRINYPTASNPRHYRDRLVREIGQSIRQVSYLFDADFVRNFSLELIIIGKDVEISNLLEELRNLSPAKEITMENIIRFFDFK